MVERRRGKRVAGLISQLERYWFDVGNRRNFFEKFAARHGFDPLIAENWYTVSKESIIKTKVQKKKKKKKKKSIFLLVLVTKSVKIEIYACVFFLVPTKKIKIKIKNKKN
jgi:hypothetical protein